MGSVCQTQTWDFPAFSSVDWQQFLLVGHKWTLYVLRRLSSRAQTSRLCSFGNVQGNVSITAGNSDFPPRHIIHRWQRENSISFFKKISSIPQTSVIISYIIGFHQHTCERSRWEIPSTFERARLRWSIIKIMERDVAFWFVNIFAVVKEITFDPWRKTVIWLLSHSTRFSNVWLWVKPDSRHKLTYIEEYVANFVFPAYIHTYPLQLSIQFTFYNYNKFDLTKHNNYLSFH